MSSAIDLFRLDGKTALITGASKNIGKAVAQAFAEAGADLILIARTHPVLEDAASDIRRSTGRAVATRACDVGSAEQLENLVSELAQTGPHVDILVNNAFDSGAHADVPLLKKTDANWQRTLDVNLFGPLRLSRALIPPMIEAGGGVVLNVLSGVAFSPLPAMGPYSVSKAALWMLTRCLARECAPVVRVNGLCPGSMREETDKRPIARSQLAATPLARIARGQEAAGAALFLASDASSFSTGDVVFVNGGLTSLSSYPIDSAATPPAAP
jgi:NAD(P)-dependent dehydrogenase (short-subunit alcohol dehydrogenase family)